ncbi:MAG: hypothetical protein U9R27_11575 [Campylobacterota bacterium]|nr:hypothetical protein [Campylobacterota bacterium]
MPSSLDKLKALTSRLDDKLAEKKALETSLSISSEAVTDLEPETKTDTKEPASKPLSKEESKEKPKKESKEKPKEKSKELTTEEPKPKDPKPSKKTQESTTTLSTKNENPEEVREENIERVWELYNELKILEKSPDFDKIFLYKAMNLSGIGLKEEDFGMIRTGKYIQVIAITYEPDATGKKKAKNISLGYFGKGETIDPNLKNLIIEFVLRWRYEKAFQNLEHYKNLIAKLE